MRGFDLPRIDRAPSVEAESAEAPEPTGIHPAQRDPHRWQPARDRGGAERPKGEGAGV